MHLAASILSMLFVATACTAEYRDGRQVEGVWIGEGSSTVADCAPQERCERIIEVAAAQLLARVPDARVRAVRFFDLPHRSADGSAMSVTSWSYQIVFSLEDGSERIEQFECDMHGGLRGVGNPAYAEFCPPPTTGG